MTEFREMIEREGQQGMKLLISDLQQLKSLALNPLPNMYEIGNGNVGVGTTTPERRLDVNGDVVIRSGLSVGGNSSSVLPDGRLLFDTETTALAGILFRVQESGSFTNRFCLLFDTTDNASFPFLTNRTPNGAVAIMTGTAAGAGENEHFRIEGGDGTVAAYFQNTDLGIDVTAPRGKLHAYDSISGFLLWEYDGLDATVRTIIPNGTGDVLYRLHAAYVMRDSAGAVASGTTDVSNSASVNLTVGTNTVRLRVNANGSCDIARTAGTDTIRVALTLRWL